MEQREIKFRAVFDGKIVEYIKWQEGNWMYSEDLLHWYFEMKHAHSELQQFTGLKDKNGVLIYEGDIVFDEDGEYSKTIRIDCENEYLQFFGKDIYTDDTFELEEIGDECLIIGNIYENPELLK